MRAVQYDAYGGGVVGLKVRASSILVSCGVVSLGGT
jgi:hypothetical protein